MVRILRPLLMLGIISFWLWFAVSYGKDHRAEAAQRPVGQALVSALAGTAHAQGYAIGQWGCRKLNRGGNVRSCWVLLWNEDPTVGLALASWTVRLSRSECPVSAVTNSQSVVFEDYSGHVPYRVDPWRCLRFQPDGW